MTTTEKGLCLGLCLIVAGADSGFSQVYPDFNTFSSQSFGAEKDALIYQMFGNDLAFKNAGIWIHESQNSAALGFETNLPAKSYVEYGATSSYGQRTADPDRHYYLHLHYLTGLAPNRTYHYRWVAVDERGNVLRSADKTLQTKTFAGAVMVPGALSGPPYVLDQANTRYVLTQDIFAHTRAFTIKANGVILDLNGHVVTYDQSQAFVKETTWDQYVYSSSSTFGVWGNQNSCAVFNGVIRQGQNNGRGSISYGFNPVYVTGQMELAGLTLEYSGHSVGGLIARYGDMNVHHNVIVDQGTGIDNRHLGIKAIEVKNLNFPLHHNLIKRCRHQAIIPGGAVHSNELYVDSYDTNSFGIKPINQVYDNKIFGTGYHMVGVGWGSQMTISGNLIHLQCEAPTTRSAEYGAQSSVNGLRLTQYGGSVVPYENNLYFNNTIIAKGRGGCNNARGIQFFSDPYVKNLVFRNNTIKTEAQDALTSNACCVVPQGLSDRGPSQLPIFYNDNTFISNICHIRFGDDYGSGGNHQFRNARMIRFGTDSRYRGINAGYWIYDSFNNLLIDTKLEGGAVLDNPSFTGSGKVDYSVGHSLYVKAQDDSGAALADKQISVFDSLGAGFVGWTDSQGLAKIELLEYLYGHPAGQTVAVKTMRSGHDVRIDGYAPVMITPTAFEMRDNQANPIVLVFGGSSAVPQKPRNLRLKN